MVHQLLSYPFARCTHSWTLDEIHIQVLGNELGLHLGGSLIHLLLVVGLVVPTERTSKCSLTQGNAIVDARRAK